MKRLLTEATGVYADESAIGLVHLIGPIDTTACGLAEEDYESESTTKPVTCPTCQTYLSWAKKVAKLKS